jgi:23S rRNA (pseudouridine1915-N3)-methyltransferase
VKILVLSVGRPERVRFGPLCDDSAGRIRRFGVELSIASVKEVRADGRYSAEHAMEREARELRGAIPERSRVIALDPSGTALASDAFARRLEGWAASSATFVIGGPLGLDRGLVAAAHASISLSPMTLPHEIARVVLFEQLYRALTILRGVPYHK